MNPTFLTFLLFFCLQGSFGQSVDLALDVSHIHFQRRTDSTSIIYDRIGVKDTNTIVIAMWKSGLQSYGIYSDYFIIYTNGDVQHLETFESSNTHMRTSYSKSCEVKDTCKESLFKLIIESDFEYNQDSLSAMPTPIKTDSLMIYINTWDGLSYGFTIVKGSHHSHYSTRSPDSIIEARSVGHIEKKRFMDLIQGLERVSKCCEKSKNPSKE